MQEGRKKTRKDFGCIISILVAIAIFSILIRLTVGVFSKGIENYLDNKIREQQEITTEFDKDQN